MIEGNVSLDELMSRLITAQETYQSQLSLEIKEEEERAARDAVKREQDLAFEMSLVVSYLEILRQDFTLGGHFLPQRLNSPQL